MTLEEEIFFWNEGGRGQGVGGGSGGSAEKHHPPSSAGERHRHQLLAISSASIFLYGRLHRLLRPTPAARRGEHAAARARSALTEMRRLLPGRGLQKKNEPAALDSPADPPLERVQTGFSADTDSHSEPTPHSN